MQILQALQIFRLVENSYQLLNIVLYAFKQGALTSGRTTHLAKDVLDCPFSSWW